MSGFCIFRAEKHNSVGAVSAALSHDLRARQTPNADPKLYNKNTYSSSDIDAVLTEMKRLVDSCDENARTTNQFCAFNTSLQLHQKRQTIQHSVLINI